MRIVDVPVVKAVFPRHALISSVRVREAEVPALLERRRAVVAGIAHEREIREDLPRDPEPALHAVRLLPKRLVAALREIEVHLVVHRDEEERRAVAMAEIQGAQFLFPDFEGPIAWDVDEHQPRPCALERDEHARPVRRVEPDVRPRRGMRPRSDHVVREREADEGLGKPPVVGHDVRGHVIPSADPERPAVVDQPATREGDRAEPDLLGMGIDHPLPVRQRQGEGVEVRPAGLPEARADLRRLKRVCSRLARVERDLADLASAQVFARHGMPERIGQPPDAPDCIPVRHGRFDARAVQPGPEPAILHAEPVADDQPDGTPDPARMVRVEAVRKVFGVEGAVLAVGGVEFFPLPVPRQRVLVVDALLFCERLLRQNAADLHGEDVSARMHVFSEVDRHRSEHADVLMDPLTVDIDLTCERDALEIDKDALFPDPLGQVEVVAVPCAHRLLPVEGIIHAARERLHPVGIALPLVHPPLAPGLPFEPCLQRDPAFRDIHRVRGAVIIERRGRIARYLLLR